MALIEALPGLSAVKAAMPILTKRIRSSNGLIFFRGKKLLRSSLSVF